MVFPAKSFMEIIIRNSHNSLMLARFVMSHVRLLVVRYLLGIASGMSAPLWLILLRALPTVLLFLLA